MPLLGMFLSNVVVAVATWFLKFFSQKLAFTVASLAVVSALSVALYVALRLAMNTALGFATSFHPMFGVGISMVISPRTAGLLTAYVAFWSLVELYKWKMTMTLFWGRALW